MKVINVTINDQGAIRITDDALGSIAFTESADAKAHLLQILGEPAASPRLGADFVASLADFCRRLLRVVNTSDAFFLAYVAAGVLTFGAVASNHKANDEDARVEKACYGIAGAIGWPLYWSWRMFEHNPEATNKP